jgi:ribose-phosphate pyrophosphokinase
VPILAQYFKEKFKGADDIVIVSPDVGSVSRSRKFAERIDAPIAIIDKRRPKANVCEVMNVIGDVKGKRLVLVDDLIDTAGTMVNGIQAFWIWGKRGVCMLYPCGAVRPGYRQN